jgi:hypothetical protein
MLVSRHSTTWVTQPASFSSIAIEPFIYGWAMSTQNKVLISQASFQLVVAMWLHFGQCRYIVMVCVTSRQGSSRQLFYSFFSDWGHLVMFHWFMGRLSGFTHMSGSLASTAEMPSWNCQPKHLPGGLSSIMASRVLNVLLGSSGHWEPLLQQSRQTP